MFVMTVESDYSVKSGALRPIQKIIITTPYLTPLLREFHLGWEKFAIFNRNRCLSGNRYEIGSQLPWSYRMCQILLMNLYNYLPVTPPMSGGAPWAPPAGFGAELRMASPNTIISLIVGYHAAIGGKTPVAPLRTPLDASTQKCSLSSLCSPCLNHQLLG